MTDNERTELQKKINRYDWLERRVSGIKEKQKLLRTGNIVIDINGSEIGRYIRFDELSEKSMKELKNLIDGFLDLEIQKIKNDMEDL